MAGGSNNNKDGKKTKLLDAVTKALGKIRISKPRTVQTRDRGRLQMELSRKIEGKLPQGTNRGTAAAAPHTKPRWEPNTTYRVPNSGTGSNYTYRTDENGRVVHAEGRLVPNPARRNPDQQVYSGGADRLPGDAGGHLFAREFGGSREGINYVPMDSKLNSGGRWQQMEHEWAKQMRAGNQVDVSTAIGYSGPGERPDRFDVQYTVTPPNGGAPTVVNDVFKNQ